MTREAFYENIKQLGWCIYFDLLGEKYTISYLPVYNSKTNTIGFDEICICANKILDSIHYDTECSIEDYDFFLQYSRYKSIEEMLNNYLINGIPLGELLDKVENMNSVCYG